MFYLGLLQPQRMKVVTHILLLALVKALSARFIGKNTNRTLNGLSQLAMVPLGSKNSACANRVVVSLENISLTIFSSRRRRRRRRRCR